MSTLIVYTQKISGGVGLSIVYSSSSSSVDINCTLKNMPNYKAFCEKFMSTVYTMS